MLKKERTPEQKEKFNKKLFKVFISLVLIVCAAIGAYNAFKTIDVNQFTNLNAFTELKQNGYNIGTILASAKLTSKDLLNHGTAELQSTLEGGNVDLFTSNQFDADKWTYCDCLSTGFTLDDVNAGMLTKQLYTGVRAVGISVESGNMYNLTMVEYISFSTFTDNQTLLSLLPANSYITTNCVMTVADGKLTIVSSKVRYNGLNQEKSDVITSTINGTDNSVSNYSARHFVATINALAEKTNTAVSLSSSNCVFTSLT